MKNIIPDGISKSELVEILRELKTYRTFRKKLGKRGVSAFAAERS